MEDKGDEAVSKHHYVMLQELLEDEKQGRSPSKNKSRFGHASDFFMQHPVWQKDSRAIPLTYICLAFLVTFPAAYMEYYPRTLNASDAQLSTLSAVRNLPWCFKVVFGVLADGFPLKGLRFKPYMLLGLTIASGFHLAIALHDQPSMLSFALLLSGAMFGIVMTDVMVDALVASRAIAEEDDHCRGNLQSVVYLCRLLSEMIGYWLGAILSNRDAWHFGLTLSQVFWILVLIPGLVVVPQLWVMQEPTCSTSSLQPLRCQFEKLWNMLKLRATWQSLGFLVLFNSCLVRNAAWGNYLKVAYAFDAFQYGAMMAIGASVMFLGMYVYRQYIMHQYKNSWHQVFLFTGVVMACFSLLNILLVFHLNDQLGIGPFWFAVGDAAMVSFAKGMQMLPCAIIYVLLCPLHQEGIGFALLSSISNVSHEFSTTLSNLLLRIWPVQLEDLEHHDYSGVWKLTALTALISLVPLFFTQSLLPCGHEQLILLKQQQSVIGARILFGLYLLGLCWVCVVNVLALSAPCHGIVGGSGCS